MAHPRMYHRRQPIHQGYNPVLAAVATEKQRRLTTDLAVLVALADEGQEHRELLAEIACLVGVGAEIAVHVNKDHPLARRLHGTLRTIVQMALNGCRWQQSFAHVIAEDLQTCQQLAKEFPEIGLAAAPACKALARDIRENRLHPDAIAGAEIYRETQGTTA